MELTSSPLPPNLAAAECIKKLAALQDTSPPWFQLALICLTQRLNGPFRHSTCFGVFPQCRYLRNIWHRFLPGSWFQEDSISYPDNLSISLHSLIALANGWFRFILQHWHTKERATQAYKQKVSLLFASPIQDSFGPPVNLKTCLNLLRAKSFQFKRAPREITRCKATHSIPISTLLAYKSKFWVRMITSSMGRAFICNESLSWNSIQMYVSYLWLSFAKRKTKQLFFLPSLAERNRSSTRQ